MTPLTVSVVIVSRGRADLLKRCLLGVSQLQYDSFEVVVVADPAGVIAALEMPFASDLKIVPFDEPNISAARNLGIGHSAGDIIAFIDDDAVPEPQWLRYLVAPAMQSDVAAMGGFVRGRNGISWQWKAHSLDRFGEAHPLEVDAENASVLRPPQGQAIKTEGTNMAFRRDVLIELGGFDPAFHYFLDETDLNMRLARAGYATAVVPLAEVHHGFAPNQQRTQSRVPRDSFDIGASWAVFQRKHVAEADRAEQWKRLRNQEWKRFLRHLISGGVEPHSLRRLMRRLDEGYAAGLKRSLKPLTVATHSFESMKPFPALARVSQFLSTRSLFERRALSKAAMRVHQGEIVTVFSLSPTALYHKTFFTPEGVWVQKGGLYGRSDRNAALVKILSRRARIRLEADRVAKQRGLGNK